MAEELATPVCGENFIDVQFLRQNTKYEGRYKLWIGAGSI